jgi:hypothetical protein
MTTQPMPLEEVIARLQNGPIDTVVERSALHHLEAGKRLRAAAVEACIGLGAYKASFTPEICDSLNEQLCRGHDLIMEALSTTPTEEPQG